MKGVLVRTGKFLPTDLEKAHPDAVLGSFAELPAWLSGQA
jgi:phosphoglycolate phosphatase-like HAD superfamily hydrolase